MADPTTDGLVEDPVAFWEERHQDFDAWRSGGDRGLTLEENREFYAIRVGQVLRLVRRHHSLDRALHVLDAGCGRGHLTDALGRSGHRVLGIDSSVAAIEEARASYPWDFEVADLSRYVAPRAFNVVVCMDVLFHVLDDEAWRGCVRALVGAAATESLILLVDAFESKRRQIHDYIVHRSAAEYDDALLTYGFERVELLPYAYGANPNAFAAYQRKL